VDLLTVLVHEMGDVLGLKDLSGSAAPPSELMDEVLPVGQRRLPSAADVAQIVSDKTGSSGQSTLEAVFAAARQQSESGDPGLSDDLSGPPTTAVWSTSTSTSEYSLGNLLLPVTVPSAVQQVDDEAFDPVGVGSHRYLPDTKELDELFAGLAQSQGDWLLN
jgi:hypothetical protein